MSTIAAAPTTEKIGFAPTPLRILLDSTLSPWSKLAYGIVQYHDRGNGCFASRETMAAELNTSTYHIRIGVHQLLERGELTIEERGMGRTDIIRLTDRTFGIPVDPDPPTVEFTEPEFELPPEPELPEEPQQPGQPVEVEPIELVEPIEVEPEETEFQPVSTGLEKLETPRSKTRNYKYISSEEDINKKNTLCTKPGITELLDTDHQKKQCDEEKLISHFFEKKEDRQPTQNEIHNWRKTARRLLDEFTIDELKPAVENAIDQGARLFYFTALTAPSFVLDQRQKKQIDSDRQKQDSKAIKDEQQREHQLNALRRSAREFDAQTQDLLAGLEAKMRPQTFNVWFASSFITNITPDTLTLAVASPGAVEWIREKYMGLLQEASGKAHVEVISAEEGASHGG